MSIKANKITLYGTKFCGESIMARILLKKYKIDYIDVDIDSDADGEEIVFSHNNGNRSVPTIFFLDGEILVEPSPRELIKKIK